MVSYNNIIFLIKSIALYQITIKNSEFTQLCFHKIVEMLLRKMSENILDIMCQKEMIQVVTTLLERLEREF